MALTLLREYSERSRLLTPTRQWVLNRRRKTRYSLVHTFPLLNRSADKERRGERENTLPSAYRKLKFLVWSSGKGFAVYYTSLFGSNLVSGSLLRKFWHKIKTKNWFKDNNLHEKLKHERMVLWEWLCVCFTISSGSHLVSRCLLRKVFLK